jgi:hypothetical protein
MRTKKFFNVGLLIVSVISCGNANANSSLIYFSTEVSFTATAGPHAGQLISDGDLLSSDGRVIARNADLLKNFGPEPVVPDYGLDGVFVTGSGEILFSLEDGFWDEKLSIQIGHGDWLSNKGMVVKTNQQLLQNFSPMPSPGPYDYGLDAAHDLASGETWFSNEETFWDEVLGIWVSHGDLLSDTGKIILTNYALLSNFHPMPPPPNYGLDAVHIIGKQTLFSIEEGFWDEFLSRNVSDGDLLSADGTIVMTNAQLLAGFFGGAANVPQDYGLDAVWVVPEPITLLLFGFGALLLRKR